MAASPDQCRRQAPFAAAAPASAPSPRSAKRPAGERPWGEIIEIGEGNFGVSAEQQSRGIFHIFLERVLCGRERGRER